MESTFKCLFKDTLLWRVVMSMNLRNPEEGYIEEPAAKDFVSRKAHIIALNEAWGTEAVKNKQQSTFILKFGNPLSIPYLSCTVLLSRGLCHGRKYKLEAYV